MTAGNARIVLAEDNYLVREGTRALLEDSGRVTVVAAVPDATALRRAVDEFQPDAVITDIRMPPDNQLDGIVAAHDIRAAHPTIGVVVLSQHLEDDYALELFRHGTSGLAYLLKERIGDLTQVLHAVDEVRAGRSVLDPDVVDALIATRMPGRPADHGLTPARTRGVAPHGAGQDQRRRSRATSTCRIRRSRNTSTRSSPSSGCGRSPWRTTG